MSAELRAFIAFILIVGVGWVGYQELFNDSAAVRVVLQDVHGTVELRSGSQVAPARVGAEVGAADRLVAGADGQAVLAFGGESRVTLEANSSLQVTSVDETGVRVSLEDGRVQATVRPGSPGLDIRSGGRTVTASDADFSVVRGAGGVGVETTRGAVDVDGVPVVAGRRAVIADGATPMQMPASESLLLQVAWPGLERTPSGAVRLVGTTEPGASVRVRTPAGDVRTTAGPDGAFAVDAALGEGENAVAVEAVNVFGQASTAQWHVVRDSTPPRIGVKIE